MTQNAPPNNEFSGQVLKGYGYPHKMPTANVDHQGLLPQGVFLGLAFVEQLSRSGAGVLEAELGRCMVWSYPNSTIAEVFISGFSGNLYGQTLIVYDLEQLSRKDLTVAATAAIESLPTIAPSL